MSNVNLHKLRWKTELQMRLLLSHMPLQITLLSSNYKSTLNIWRLDNEATLATFPYFIHLVGCFSRFSQAVNFWQTLVMNDEHTERRYLLYFLLSWGLPALVIIILVTVLLGGYSWSIHDVYGLVQGEL